ncbi:gyf domain-containing protein [Zymoseptoria brevis]|uniref:Gyf domain-containing protein n=1 Tax=Zymoseptoria brevis TaxID=1047168 RepID=A0A0F4GW35_9PEZI|nr:gyf domain-containing protein [Zymoseptoria brevis]
MAHSFASAAAGVNSNANSNPPRDPASDWARRTNGATQTFRRPSGATTTPSATLQTDGAASQPARYVPPHRNGTIPDTRYTREQLLDIYKSQLSSEGGLRDGLPNLVVGGWAPDITNGNSSGWGRNDHSREAQNGPDACWDREGNVEPLGLVEMDDEEREFFTTSVNTPLKSAPAPHKDGQPPNGLGGHKLSISNNAASPGGYGLPSPSLTRGAGRRRETSESYPFPQNVSSPGGFGRDDTRAQSPPASLLRRRTDIKDAGKTEGSESEDKSTNPFGSIKRNPNGPLSAGFAAPTSPWSAGPQSAGMSPMGSFVSFGLGSGAGQLPGSAEKSRALGSGRAESRFKNVLSKDGGEESSQRTLESKASMTGLSRVNENESWQPQGRGGPSESAEDNQPSGSAVLAADADASPSNPRQGYRGFGTPSRQGTQDDFGFGAFGMTSDTAHDFGNTRAGQSAGGNAEPMSPTGTNPYQSPEQQSVDRMTEESEHDNSESHNAHLPGLGGLGGLGALPNLGRVPGGPAGDRSQTSSVGPNRGFGGLGGLGQLGNVGAGGWPSSQAGLGTPGRQTAGLSNAFGNGLFNMSDVQSPGLAGLGAGMLGGPGAPYGGSRMASMFPPSMQDPMRQHDAHHDDGNGRFGAFDQSRGTDSPFGNLGFAGQQDTGDGQFGQEQDNSQSHGQSQVQGSSASNQPPAPQQRTMVMPDRMRWIYRDPQGQTQGPWSGLEMHDWYKAGFFSPELLVKKYEDPDYEPLAQLIRRIGNSREPFLVPQIGIPHGAPSTAAATPWAGAGPASGPAPVAGGAQPPFASSFPSFGTTLTADQQNALERRKQEEQYLMARQKEHLAQAQIAQRMHGHSLAGQLHHHASAHSLQSQPSFGSIASPTAYQPSPIQGPAAGGPVGQGFFDNSFRGPQAGGLGAVGAGIDSLGNIREEEIPGMDRLNLGGNRIGAGQFGAPGQPFSAQQHGQDDHDKQIHQMLQDRARLQQEQTEHDARQNIDERPETNERLQQFQQLQQQNSMSTIDARFHQAQEKALATETKAATTAEQQPQEPLSLTEQVQKAASAKHSPAPQQPGLPQPFPPAPSQSPLPAPAAQRAGRQSVADQLQTDSRDRSSTPSVDTPSIAVAPWAKEPAEASRGPSLKEIQEVEAKKAAEAEEVAAAARRAAFQRELEAQAHVNTAPQPGLPTSSTWGAVTPTVGTPTGAMPAAWAKTATKPAGPTASKTLAQIQKEEEARKRKLAAAAAAAQAQASLMGAAPAPAVGKSYATLAGKITIPPVNPNAPGSAWTTVGASGKVKTPGGPAISPAGTRTASQGVLPAAASIPAAIASPALVRKAPVSRSASMANPGAVNPHDEFRKWAINELRPDLKKGINVDEFVGTLVILPPESEVITEAVHGVSNTIDSRHFAEEFIRRKRLADKGLVDTSIPKSASPALAADNKTGGWNEVAKKGPSKEPVKEEANGNFRVVASKKKGGKK